MKNLFVVSLALASIGLNAQTFLSTDVIGFFFENYGMQFEYPYNAQNSFALNANYTSRNKLNQGSSSQYSEYSFAPQYRYYLSTEKTADGYFAGVYLKYRSSNFKDVPLVFLDDAAFATSSEKSNVSSSSLGIGVINGYKWITSKRLFFEFDLGLGKYFINNINYSNALVNDKGSPDPDDFLPFLGNEFKLDFILSLRAGVSLGGKEKEKK